MDLKWTDLQLAPSLQQVTACWVSHTSISGASGFPALQNSSLTAALPFQHPLDTKRGANSRPGVESAPLESTGKAVPSQIPFLARGQLIFLMSSDTQCTFPHWLS